LVTPKLSRRKKPEIGSLESEARFRVFFERSADAMSLLDPQTLRYIEANEAVAKLFGAPDREALRNVSPTERWPECQPDGRLSIEKAREIVRIALDQGSRRFDWLVRRYDGTELPLDIVMTAVAFGDRTLLSLVYRDISAYTHVESEIRQLNASLERRVAERTIELARFEEKFRALFEGTSQAVFLHDGNRILEANQSWLRLLGYSSLDDVAGRQPIEFAAPIQPGGERAEVLGTKHLTDALTHGSARFEWMAIRRDGTEVPMEVCLNRIQLGSRQLLQAFCNDITVRKRAEAELRESEARLRESEERFRKAFRANPVQLSIMRASDKKFIEVNDALVQWLGLDRDRILGRDSLELGMWVNLDDRAKFWADLELSKGSLREIEIKARSQRGTVHTLLVSAESIEINREPHLFIFALDITERKKAEAELLRTLAREKELGQLRSKFVSMVSHEFRTPLGIIQSSAEILEDYLVQLEPSERKDHLQSIRQNTHRMAAIMEEALFIGSFDAGKMEFKPATVELRKFLQGLVDEVLSITGGRCPIGLSLSETPAEIKADERLLRHIFTNLLTNAVKYSDAGSPVRFEIAPAGGDIVCAIRDQGIGIPEPDREWLFSGFHRGHNVDDRPGTGLGLVIVKRCVDLYGGKINVDSRLGVGTKVTVRLPI
jgi:PAS domain S-box-containing protein